MTIGPFNPAFNTVCPQERSDTVNNNQNPEWEWEARLGVDNPSLAGHILLEVFDEDVGKDDLLGVVAIPTSDILRGGKLTRSWHALDQAKSGEVCVSMHFQVTPRPQPADRRTSKPASVTSSTSHRSASATFYVELSPRDYTFYL